MSEINKRIRELRVDAGLTTTKLAELIGVSQGNISDWENDKRNSTPTSKSLIAIATYFHVSLDWLLTGKEFKSKNTLFLESKRVFNDLIDDDEVNFLNKLHLLLEKITILIKNHQKNSQINEEEMKQLLKAFEEISLTDEEKELLRIFRLADEKYKWELLGMVKMAITTGETTH